QNVAKLLGVLRGAGYGDAARTLLARDPTAHASLEDLQGVTRLLDALRGAGASDAARTLADRAAAHSSLGNRWGAAELLRALRKARASDAARTLAGRAANAGMFDVRPDAASGYQFGREPDGVPSQSWKWQESARTLVAER